MFDVPNNPLVRDVKTDAAEEHAEATEEWSLCASEQLVRK